MGKKDIEKGGDEPAQHHDDYEGLDEYAALQKFITTYRDPKAAHAEEEAEEGEAKKAPWYAPWKKSKGGPGGDLTVPPAWLEADIQTGISESDVQARRKKFGWNEIVTEKENLFLKFLGFFQGPVLYSKLPAQRTIWRPRDANNRRSYGGRCPARRWSPQLDRFRCHHWYSRS